MLRRCAQLIAMLSLLFAFGAQAQTRAWIDRDQVALGDTLTLNIETDGDSGATPDYSPLQTDFIVSGNSSSRQMEIVNGRRSSRMLFAVALQPRREGLLMIPSLAIGTQSTQPLQLTVTAAAPPSRAGSDAFIETDIDSQSPYVQQAVGMTLRLYYAQPLVSGQLDQDSPDGASLQRVGSDIQYSRDVAGQRYTVVERRFLLIPDRSGPLTIPGAHFQGQSAGGFFDDVFGNGRKGLRANGAPRFLDVRSIPANAPQPWLPLRGLTMRYLEAPQQVRAGEAATIVVEATVDGATASQVPELQLPSIDGAQVFADPAQVDETFDNGRPQVKVTRKFSIVPAQAGALRVPGPRMPWWDARAATARSASLPDLSLQVAAGVQGESSIAPASTANPTTQPATIAPSGEKQVAWDAARIWPILAMLFAMLWLLTLAWGFQQQHRRQAVVAAVPPGRAAADHVIPATRRALKQVLDTGDLGDIADVLCTMASPAASSLDDLASRLADERQRAAIGALQSARWGDGDPAHARNLLRASFAKGPQWRAHAVQAGSPLPPLYPE